MAKPLGTLPGSHPVHWLPWLRHLWGGGRLSILVVRLGGRPVAVAPFFLWGYGQRPEIIRVSFAGSGVSDYLGLLAEPETAREAAGAVWVALAARETEWHVCDLQELAPSSPLLHSHIPERFRIDDSPCGKCPVLTLPRRYEDLVAGLPGKFRADLRRASNRLRSAGEVEFRRAGGDDLEEHLSGPFRLHGERWEARQQDGMLSTGPGCRRSTVRPPRVLWNAGCSDGTRCGLLRRRLLPHHRPHRLLQGPLGTVTQAV